MGCRNHQKGFRCLHRQPPVSCDESFLCLLSPLGEILGLTWNNVHITDEDIAADNAWIYIDKELQRADYSVMQTLSNKDVFHVFPCVMEGRQRDWC